jgi:hypothetical protein
VSLLDPLTGFVEFDSCLPFVVWHAMHVPAVCADYAHTDLFVFDIPIWYLSLFHDSCYDKYYRYLV